MILTANNGTVYGVCPEAYLKEYVLTYLAISLIASSAAAQDTA